jgi:hypothetical protein
MAQALGVTVEDLLIVGDEKPPKKKAAKTNEDPPVRCVRFSSASPNYPAASRNTSSIGFLHMSHNTSNPDNDPDSAGPPHIFLTASNFPNGSLVTKPSNIQMPRIVTPSNSPSNSSPASSRDGAESRLILPHQRALRSSRPCLKALLGHFAALLFYTVLSSGSDRLKRMILFRQTLAALNYHDLLAHCCFAMA